DSNNDEDFGQGSLCVRLPGHIRAASPANTVLPEAERYRLGKPGQGGLFSTSPAIPNKTAPHAFMGALSAPAKHCCAAPLPVKTAARSSLIFCCYIWRIPMALERSDVEKIAHLARLG